MHVKEMRRRGRGGGAECCLCPSTDRCMNPSTSSTPKTSSACPVVIITITVTSSSSYTKTASAYSVITTTTATSSSSTSTSSSSSSTTKTAFSYSFHAIPIISFYFSITTTITSYSDSTKMSSPPSLIRYPPEKHTFLLYHPPLHPPVSSYFFSPICMGGAVAQSVERATSGEAVMGSIPALSTRSLLVGSVSV